MKSKIPPAVLLSGLPSLIGLVIIICIVFSAEHKRAEDLIQAYTESIAGGLSTFFLDASITATTAATLHTTQDLNFERAIADFRALVRANQRIYRISMVDADGYVYDVIEAGSSGNPYQGWRRTTDNNDPNAEPTNLSQQPHFRELVTNNTTGEFYTLTDKVYVPQGLYPKAFVTSAPIIKNGKSIGMINVAQTSVELSRLYEDLTMDFLDKFGDKAHLILVSNKGQLISYLIYNKSYGAYMDELYATPEIGTISMLGIDDFDDVVERAIASKNHITSSTYHGESHFIGGAQVQGTPFGVFLAVAKRHMLPALRQVVIVGIVAFALTMLSFAVWFILMPSLTVSDAKKPPKTRRRKLTKAMRKMRAKEEEDAFTSPVLPPDSRK